MKRFKQILVNSLLGLVGMALVFALAFYLQVSALTGQQRQNSAAKLETAAARLDRRQQSAEERELRFDAFTHEKMQTIAYLLDQQQGFGEAELSVQAKRWDLTQLACLTKAEAQKSGYTAGEWDALVSGEAVIRDAARYYGAVLADGRLLVGARDASALEAVLANAPTPDETLSDMRVGENGFLILLDAEGSPGALARGLTDEDIARLAQQRDWNGEVRLSLGAMEAQSRTWNGQTLIALVPRTELRQSALSTVGLAMGVMALVLVLMVAYGVFIRTEEGTKQDREYYRIGHRLRLDRHLTIRLRNLLALGLAAAFCISLYVQTMDALGQQSLRADEAMESLRGTLADNGSDVSELIEEYTQEYVARAQRIASALAENPALLTHEHLLALAQRANLAALYVFDRDGKTVATSTRYYDFALSEEEESQSYPFWDVVKGYTDVLVQDPQEDDTGEHSLLQYMGVARQDAPGMVQLAVAPEALASRLAANQLSEVLAGQTVVGSGFFMAVNHQQGTVTYAPQESHIGKAIADLGMTDSVLKDQVMDFQTIGGVSCFIKGVRYADVNLLVAAPLSAVLSGRLTLSLLTTLVCGAMLVLLGAGLARVGRDDSVWKAPPDRRRPRREPRGTIEIVSPDGSARRVQSLLSRWSMTGKIPWRERTAGQKFSALLSITMYLAAVGLVLLLAAQRGQENTVLSYVMNLQWERKINLFSLTYIAFVVLEVAVLTRAARLLILMVGHTMGARGETVARLTDSFIKYVAGIGTLFYALSFVGVASQTLLASAGILTLAVGTGARSLTNDIIAGIFIVFEGAYRVGDIVTLGDWRGTVLEIGIRTTKIEDANRNIKIINNATINNVINMTRRYSYAVCDVLLNLDESLERFESLLDLELPKIRCRLREIEAGPFYQGTVAIDALRVTVRIIAQCQEKDRVTLERNLRRELKLVMERYEINGVKVKNTPDVLSAGDRAIATEFVKEQQELTRNIHLEK